MSQKFFKVNHLFDGYPDERRSNLSRGGVEVVTNRGTSRSQSPIPIITHPLDLQPIPLDSDRLSRSVSAKRPVVKKVTKTVTTIENEPLPLIINPPVPLVVTIPVQGVDIPDMPIVMEDYQKTTRRSMYDLGDRKYQQSIGPDEFQVAAQDRNTYYHPDHRVRASMRRTNQNDDDKFNVFEDSIDQPELEYKPMSRSYVRALNMDDDPEFTSKTTVVIY